MTISLSRDGSFEVEIVQRIAPGGDAPRAVARRLENLRSAAARGEDDWSRRLERAEPVRWTTAIDRAGGEIREVRHKASFERLEDLGPLFDGSDVRVEVEREAGEIELVFLADRSRRATFSQREALDEALDEWIAALSDYLRGLAELYRYLERRPGRSRAVLGAILADALEDSERERLPEPDEREREILDRIGQTMTALAGIFTVPEGEPYTLEEILALAHDPFPAPLEIVAPFGIEEASGFAERDGRFVVPGLSLFRAWKGLAPEFASPDPFSLLVPYVILGASEPLSLDAVLAEPRHAVAASESELRRRLLDALTPASAYRLRWKVEGDAPAR
ncbi:MAG: hypothetical protein D6718_07940 [Acidobacteria bacterium]|nr:MAG: hypothetical protein D6718_07940 [Acidobacteriota bacterium]